MRELTDIEHRAMHDSMSRRGIANGLIVDYSALANLQADAALGKLNKKTTYRAGGNLYNWNGTVLQLAGGIQTYTSFAAFAAAQTAGVAAAGIVQGFGQVYFDGTHTYNAVNTTSFSPEQISGLVLWTDFSDPLVTSGGAIATAGQTPGSIQDKSGSGHTFTITGTPTVSSINGTQSLRLDGASYITTDAFLSSAYATSGFTIFCVATADPALSGNAVLFGVSTPNVYLLVNGSTLVVAPTLTGVTGVGATGVKGASLSGAYCLGWQGASIVNGFNTLMPWEAENSGLGTNQASLFGTVSGSVAFTGQAIQIGALGGSNKFNGNIGEFLVFNSLLTAAQITQVQNYLIAKWGFDLPNYVCIGDSLTSGQGSTGTQNQSPITGTTNYPNQLKALLGGETAASVRTDAYAGRAVSAGAGATSILGTPHDSRLYNVLYNKLSKKKQIAIVFAGTNDIATQGSGPGVYQSIVDLCLDAQLTGYKVCLVTILPRNDAVATGFEAMRGVVNARLAANYQNLASAFVNTDINPIFQNANTGNATYWNQSSKPHLTDAGYAALAQMIFNAMVSF